MLIFGMLTYTMMPTIGWSIQEDMYPAAFGMVLPIICMTIYLISLSRI
jgi:hypothetical protein